MTESERQRAKLRVTAASFVANSVGWRLLNARICLGITIQEASDISLLSLEDVEHSETIDGSQSLDSVLRLAALYGIDPSRLFTDTETDGEK